MNTDPTYLTVAELTDAYAAGELSVTDVTEACLRRIDERNPELNAVIALRAGAALKEAAAADEQPADNRGPLHGIPLVIKDLNEGEDLPPTWGSRAAIGSGPSAEAVVVTRLRQAGAILIGSTNTPEFGLRPTTDNSAYGSTSNPFSPAHTAGGSSGGSAAAVATGMAVLGLGGDGGGSCRIPASCSEVVGMKPSRGLLTWAPLMQEAWGALASNGPLTRSVDDARRMLAAMAGPVVGEPYGVSTVSRRTGTQARWRIGVCTTPPHGEVDSEVVGAVNAAAEALAGAGHHVEEADLDLSGLRNPWEVVVAASAAMTVDHMIGDTKLAKLESNTLALALRGQRYTAGDYAFAINEMRNRSGVVMAACEPYDAILTPTLTRPPYALEPELDTESHDERWTRYLDWLAFTYPFNCTGQPAISVPGGRSREGLPLGVQLIGRMGDDEVVLSISAALEALMPWRENYR